LGGKGEDPEISFSFQKKEEEGAPVSSNFIITTETDTETVGLGARVLSAAALFGSCVEATVDPVMAQLDSVTGHWVLGTRRGPPHQLVKYFFPKPKSANHL
jgi:hypothetical protein